MPNTVCQRLLTRTRDNISPLYFALYLDFTWADSPVSCPLFFVSITLSVSDSYEVGEAYQ